MIRVVAAVVAGVLAGFVSEAAVEAAGHALFPSPAGLDIANPDLLAEYLPGIPLGAKLFLVLSWIAGSFVGGWVATAIAPSERATAAIAVGVAMLAVGAYGISAARYPWWMAALGLIVPVPSAWLAGRSCYQSISRGKNSATRSS
ncbi:MAG: hypothetical protein R2729_08780 [Bryobacteraceae bacterium]